MLASPDALELSILLHYNHPKCICSHLLSLIKEEDYFEHVFRSSVNGVGIGDVRGNSGNRITDVQFIADSLEEQRFAQVLEDYAVISSLYDQPSTRRSTLAFLVELDEHPSFNPT